MKKIFIICSLLSLVLAQNQPPAWPKAYSVQGALFIPFAGNNKRLLLIVLNKTIFICLFLFFQFLLLFPKIPLQKFMNLFKHILIQTMEIVVLITMMVWTKPIN